MKNPDFLGDTVDSQARMKKYKIILENLMVSEIKC